MLFHTCKTHSIFAKNVRNNYGAERPKTSSLPPTPSCPEISRTGSTAGQRRGIKCAGLLGRYFWSNIIQEAQLPQRDSASCLSRLVNANWSCNSLNTAKSESVRRSIRINSPITSGRCGSREASTLFWSGSASPFGCWVVNKTQPHIITPIQTNMPIMHPCRPTHILQSTQMYTSLSWTHSADSSAAQGLPAIAAAATSDIISTIHI